MSIRRKLLVATLAGALALPGAARAADPGVFNIPGTDSTIRFNGFAETALLYQLSGGFGRLATACDYYLCAPGIALSGQDVTNPQTAITSAYSRFGLSTSTPSDVGAIGVRLELDFAKGYQLIGGSATHSSNARIRHAYGTVGDWLLVGQTWSTFADLATFPDQIDENPFGNLAALRGPMIRVSLPAGAAKVTLALEDPYATNIGGTAVWNIPDLIARVDVPFSMGSMSVRGVAKQYKTEAASTFGFGAAVGAALKLGDHALVIDVAGGPGIGGYIYGTMLAPHPMQDVVVNGEDAEVWTVVGASAAVTHVWTPKVRSNLMASGIWAADQSAVRNAVVATTPAGGTPYGLYNRQVYTAGLNTIYSVASNFWVGVEGYYNYRKTMDGSDGDELRAEAVAHFNIF